MASAVADENVSFGAFAKGEVSVGFGAIGKKFKILALVLLGVTLEATGVCFDFFAVDERGGEKLAFLFFWSEQNRKKT